MDSARAYDLIIHCVKVTHPNTVGGLKWAAQLLSEDPPPPRAPKGSGCHDCKYVAVGPGARPCDLCVMFVDDNDWNQYALWEPQPQPPPPARRSCGTCKHVDLTGREDPCRSCFLIAGFPKWEAPDPVTVVPKIQPKPEERLLLTRDVAFMLSLSMRHVRQKAADGKLPTPTKLEDGRLAWRRGDVMDFINGKWEPRGG